MECWPVKQQLTVDIVVVIMLHNDWHLLWNWQKTILIRLESNWVLQQGCGSQVYIYIFHVNCSDSDKDSCCSCLLSSNFMQCSWACYYLEQYFLPSTISTCDWVAFTLLCSSIRASKLQSWYLQIKPMRVMASEDISAENSDLVLELKTNDVIAVLSKT